MVHYTYILYSQKFDKYYIGQTNEIAGRLKRHNSGSETATQPFIPWTLLWYTEKSSRAEAMLLEKKLKNLSKLRIKAFILKYSEENLLGKI